MAELRKRGRHQLGTDQGFSHHLGRQKQPLKQQPIEVKARAPLTANARSREPAAGHLDQIGATCHVATRGGDRAAQVFDQRPSDQVGAHGRGLVVLNQLAIAVVHKDNATGLQHLDPLGQPTDLGHRQSRSPAVATTALDQHHASGHRQRLLQSSLIDQPRGGEGQFVVGHAKLGQGALAAAANADHLLKGVVGATGKRQQAISRA